ncbi:MAG: hypothetical protein M3Y57_17355, partial [Acidobacteriota bacterium]|nr:hypothetical protein [Acidobacteriota bacterium]
MSESFSKIKVEAACAGPQLNLSETEKAVLREHATRAARACGWVANKRCARKPKELFRKSAQRLGDLERELYALKSGEPSDDLQWLYDNLRLVRTDIQDLESGAKTLAKLPAVRTEGDECISRPVVLGRALLAAADLQLTESNFFFFIQTVEDIEPLRLSELGAMLPGLKLVLLELIADRGFKALQAFREHGVSAPSFEIGRLIRSLRFIGEIDWKETIEQLSIVHRVLCLDPAGVYPRMDFQSREQYRQAVAKIAARSDVSEAELARCAVTMAEGATVERSATQALRDRLRHVGYYLIDDTGSEELLHSVGHRPSFGEL